MLGANASLAVPNKFHHKFINQVVQAPCEIQVFVTWNTYVKMKVSIANMAISYCIDILFLDFRESCGFSDPFFCELNATVVVLGL